MELVAVTLAVDFHETNKKLNLIEQESQRCAVQAFQNFHQGAWRSCIHAPLSKTLKSCILVEQFCEGRARNPSQTVIFKQL